MNRIYASLLVVLLVVTAGCLGGSVPDVPDASDVGASGSDDSGDDGGADANGASDGDGGDVEIVDNRTAFLKSVGSYTTTWRTTVTEDGTVVGQTEYVTRVNYDDRRYAFESRSSSDGEVRTAMTIFHADGTTYQRYGSGEEASYSASEAEFDPSYQFGAQSYVHDESDLEEFERKGTETFDGVTVTRYVMTENPAWLAGQAGSEDDVTWTDFTFEVLVDDDGLVRSQHWEAEGVDEDGVSRTVGYSYDLTDVGSTAVDEPAWTDEASEQSDY